MTRHFEPPQPGSIRALQALGMSVVLCCATCSAPKAVRADSPQDVTLNPGVSPTTRAQLMPMEVPYRRGQLTPAGYRLDSHEDRTLAITGAVVFALWYFVALASALGDSGDQRANDALLVPVVGPFVAAELVQHEDAGHVAYLVYGAMQTAGVGLMVLSELFPTERFVLIHGQSSSLHWNVGRIGSGQGVKIGGSF